MLKCGQLSEINLRSYPKTTHKWSPTMLTTIFPILLIALILFTLNKSLKKANHRHEEAVRIYEEMSKEGLLTDNMIPPYFPRYNLLVSRIIYLLNDRRRNVDQKRHEQSLILECNDLINKYAFIEESLKKLIRTTEGRNESWVDVEEITLNLTTTLRSFNISAQIRACNEFRRVTLYFNAKLSNKIIPLTAESLQSLKRNISFSGEVLRTAHNEFLSKGFNEKNLVST